MSDPKKAHRDAVDVQKEVDKRAQQEKADRKAATREKVHKGQVRNEDEINRRGGRQQAFDQNKEKKK